MKLFYRKTGQGRPLIFLHGLFGSGDNWLSVAQKLDGWEVWLPDQRNHGSSPHDARFDFTAMAADVLEFLDDQGLASAVLAGHSMGAKAAMEAALREPDRVDALVAVDMAPKTYVPKYPDFLPAMAALDLKSIRSRSDAAELLKATIPDPGTLQWLLKNLLQTPEGGWKWRLNIPALSASYDRIWLALEGGREYPGPAFFIRGGCSDYLRDSDIPAIQDLFPLSLFETLPEAGHWLHTERPEEFLKVLRACLARI